MITQGPNTEYLQIFCFIVKVVQKCPKCPLFTLHQLRLHLLSPGPPDIDIYFFPIQVPLNYDLHIIPTLTGLTSLGVSAAAVAGASADASVSIGSTAAEADMLKDH